MIKILQLIEIKKHLNKNSLNQAGYEVEIENFAKMDNAYVDEYFYAFDKADWESSGGKCQSSLHLS